MASWAASFLFSVPEGTELRRSRTSDAATSPKTANSSPCKGADFLTAGPSPVTSAADSRGQQQDESTDDIDHDWLEVHSTKSVPLADVEANPSEVSKDDVITLDSSDEEEENKPENLPKTQWVFTVRHAESRWNRAQAEYSLVGMLGENDHGLSDAGRQQAEDLRYQLYNIAARVKELDEKRQEQKLQEKESEVEATPEPEHTTATASTDIEDAEEGEDGWEDVKPDIREPHTSPEQWIRMLLNPDKVFSSPFTRAVSTASLGFRDLLRDKPLVLMKEVRERKVIGGADSTGVATGKDIPIRVKQDLSYIYQDDPNHDAVLKEFETIDIDYSGCEDEWWGGITGDDQDLIRARAAACLRKLRRTRGTMPGGGGVSILVSHSLFLRTIFNTYLCRGHHEGNVPFAIADSLCNTMLPYAGIVGCRIEWDEANRPSIKEVVPILQTQLKTPIGGAIVPQQDTGFLQSLGALSGGCACSRKTGQEGCGMM